MAALLDLYLLAQVNQALTNPYIFRGYRNAAQTLTASGDAVIQIDTVVTDPSSSWHGSSYEWVAPVSGVYRVSGEVRVTSSATGQIIKVGIYQNGAGASNGAFVPASATGQIVGSAVADLLVVAAGDTIQLEAYCSAALATSASGTTDNYLAIDLVSITAV